MQPGYLQRSNGSLLPIVTLGDYGVWDINISDWLKGWGNVAGNVKNVASGVQTVTNAAQVGIQNAQSQGLFRPTAADAFAQQYNMAAAVTPGGERTLWLAAGGVALLLVLAGRKRGRA